MSEPTNAGIITVGDERWIPGSRRPDGSYRKERKVRPGFTPLEDLQRYTTPRQRLQQQQEQQKKQQQEQQKEQQQKQKQANNKAQGYQPPTSGKSDTERLVRNLQKKLRQVQDLEQKLIKGEKLDENQREKVKKGKALRDELAEAMTKLSLDTK